MTTQTSGSITLEIGPEGDRRKIVLDGQVGKQIQVGFRAKEGGTEIKVGSFSTVIASVATALGAPSTFETDFKDKINAFKGVKGLEDVIPHLLDGQLIVTDMYLQADYDDTAQKYSFTNASFGFRVEFKGVELGPVKLAGFGVLFEYSKGDGVSDIDTSSLKALPQS
ncbi:MAG: hypothetical protein AAGK02_03380 [Pseudomonadota bacterium]